MTRSRGTILALLIVIVGAGLTAVATPPLAAQQRQETTADVPVTLVLAAGQHGVTDQTLDGTLHLRRFSARDDEVFAVGTLDANIRGIGEVGDEPVRVTVQRIRAGCDLFRLVLGPVDVDVADVTDTYLATPVAITELRMELRSDEGDRFTRLLLCGIGKVLGDGATEVDTRDLPVSADDLARLLNRAVRLFR